MLRSVFPYLAAGAGIGFIGYCIYFDHKRRSAPNFRQTLIKKRQQQVLDAKKFSTLPRPPVDDPVALQQFVLEHLQKGELNLNMGAFEASITHFALAVNSCGQPTQLLQVLQPILPPTVYSMLIESLPVVRNQLFGSSAMNVNKNTIQIKEIEDDLE